MCARPDRKPGSIGGDEGLHSIMPCLARISRKSLEIEIEIVYNMCRQIGPTAVSRATLLRHLGLISKLGPGLFDQVHLSTHLASLCVDVPRELKNCKQPQYLPLFPRISSNNVIIV
jgi:hypothetical protein